MRNSDDAKKVLIITYYWPPAGGGGVQRWMKFSKYLVRKGYQVHIYTPSNPDFPLTDQSLVDEIDDRIKVVKSSIFEPRRLFLKLAGKSVDKENLDQIFYQPEKSLKQKIGIWVRANMFIPDARITWVKKSVRILATYIKSQGISQVITTGPPHSMHLIGLRLKRRVHINWVADFRDPWTSIEYFEHLPLSTFSFKKHQRLEKQVLSTADQVITVSASWKNLFEDLGAQNVKVITNGYDHEDFQSRQEDLEINTFKIGHLGTLAFDRNPTVLWTALTTIINETENQLPNFDVELIGHVDKNILGSIEHKELQKRVSIIPYMKHAQAIRKMRSASILLLLSNQTVAENVMGRIPGKVFEYFASGVPILFIGDMRSDVAKMVQQDPRSGVFSYADHIAIKKFIMAKMSNSSEFRDLTKDKPHFYQKYERSNLTDQLIDTLESL